MDPDFPLLVPVIEGARIDASNRQATPDGEERYTVILSTDRTDLRAITDFYESRFREKGFDPQRAEILSADGFGSITLTAETETMKITFYTTSSPEVRTGISLGWGPP